MCLQLSCFITLLRLCSLAGIQSVPRNDQELVDADGGGVGGKVNLLAVINIQLWIRLLWTLSKGFLSRTSRPVSLKGPWKWQRVSEVTPILRLGRLKWVLSRKQPQHFSHPFRWPHTLQRLRLPGGRAQSCVPRRENRTAQVLDVSHDGIWICMQVNSCATF